MQSSRLDVSHIRGAETYSPQVTYTYEVNGKPHRGSRVVFGPYGSRAFEGRALRRAARQAVKRYTKGQVVDVYYNPRRPSLSVLEPGVTVQTILWIGFLILACAASFWLSRSG